MTVKVSPKYQVVIPEEIRRQVDIKAGMEVSVLSKDGIVYIIPVKSLEEVSRSLARKFGKFDPKSTRDKTDREF